MNASLPIFSFDAVGQPASLPSGPTPGSGDEAFADSLNAALAATTPVAATPAQHQTPSGESDGVAANQLGDAAGSTGELAIPAEGRPGAGAAGLSGLVERGSANASSRPVTAADGLVPGAGAASGSGAQGPNAVGSNVIGQPGIGASQAESNGIKADAGRSTANHGAGLPAGPAGEQPAAASPFIARHAHGGIESERRLSAQANAPIQTSNAAVLRASEAALANDGLNHVLPQGATSAAQASTSDAQLAQAAHAAAAGERTGLAEAALSRAETAKLDAQAFRTASAADRLFIQQQWSNAPTRTVDGNVQTGQVRAAGIHVSDAQRKFANLAAGPSTNPAPATGPAAASQGAAPAAGAPGDAMFTSLSADDRSARSPIAAAAGGRSGPTAVLTNPSAQPAIADAGVRQGAAFDGADRLQAAWPTEGVVRHVERTEPAAPLGLDRTPASVAHPSAGSQVALQIVRSLPDGVDRLSVQLQPADLGSVDIQLTFEGTGRLSAVIVAERPETLELLQRDSRLLERSLGDNGLKLSSDGLSFALRQDQQQHQQGQAFHEQAQAREAAHRAGRAYDDASDAEPMQAAQRIDGLRLLDIST